MMGTTHITGGAFAFAGLSAATGTALNTPEGIAGMAVCVFGALLPDIDHPSSKMGKLFFPLSLIIAKVCGHRGFTHSALMVVALILVGAHFAGGDFSAQMLVWGIVGYLSHLLLDSFTPKGIPLMWPLKVPVRMPLPAVRTGGKVEWLLNALMVMGTVYLFATQVAAAL